MKKTLIQTVVVMVGVFCLFSPIEAATTVTADITTPTTWTASGSPYVPNRNISISSTLTVEPGTVIKLGTNRSLFVQTTGSLIIDGATITSLYDDAYGGSTRPPGDTRALSVANGWGAINSAGTLTINGSRFLYGGRANRAMVEVGGGNTMLTGNTFRFANNAYIQSGGTATVRTNTFEDIEQFAVWQTQGSITFGSNAFTRIARESYLLSTDTFVNEGGNTGERMINLQDMVFTTSKDLQSDGLPYQFNSTRINTGTTLTLREGVVVKFWNSTNNIINDGILKALGTKEKPVILTSYFDDTAGGDSNQDGAVTVPSSGQWTRIYNNSGGSIEATGTVFRYGGGAGFSEAGLVINYGSLKVTESALSDSQTSLINTKGGAVDIVRSELARAEEGLVSNGQGTAAIQRSALLETTGNRVSNTSGIEVDASNNYWGNSTGPVVNGNPASVPVVTTNVNFAPYLSEHPICKLDCFSSVLFLPGIMGSRLYNYAPGGEEELWVSSSDAKQELMTMHSDGTSKYDVYTKDDTKADDGVEHGIVDSAYGSALYDSFLGDLETWKSEGLYTDYAFIPYDWRLSLEDIVMNGKVDVSGNLRYTEDNTDIKESYLYQKTKALEENSKSGKVTLIGHSNGGLVIKAFVQKLKDINDPLYYKIDKIILVGVPQTGTPDSVVSMLYGSKIGIAWLGVSAKRSRTLIHDMPTMYNLLPSEKLFGSINPPIEFVGNNIDTSITSRYGDKINSYGEMRDFFLGAEGRSRPSYEDMLNPEVLNESLLNQAEEVHQTLDSFVPAPETEVIQIAGWGMYTVAGLRVVDEKICVHNIIQNGRPVCSISLDTTTVEDKMSLNGDATVLVPSAHDMPENPKIKKYWVDLGTYNNRAFIQRFIPDTKHKNILEVNSLRPFIKSLIDENIVDTEDDYITSFEPTPLNKPYIKYDVHSPLHLTVTDSEGRIAGWNSTADIVVEDIKGAQYFEIGEIKTVLIPRDTAHTVRLTAYAEGSFTFTQTELQGETVMGETKFEAIPTLANTVVEIAPGSVSLPTEMEIDFDADGTTETTLEAAPGETQVYENPAAVDTAPPEARIGYDTKSGSLLVTSPEEGVYVTKAGYVYTLTDQAGNTTKLTFTSKNRREKGEYTLQSIQYNAETPRVLRDTRLRYFYKEDRRKDEIKAFTSYLHSDNDRLTAHYLKKKNKTYIMDRREDEDADPETCERRGIRKVLPGLVVPYMETVNGKININY
ncbi:MAG: hypothetical protein KIH67_001535 [Candidatus Moranbacteria bacterium]|nr:hypothetical protein [Candidatus Moranbacteria bacterium]